MSLGFLRRACPRRSTACGVVLASLAFAGAGMALPPLGHAGPAPTSPQVRSAASAAAIADRYLVKLKDNAAARTDSVPAMARGLVARHHGRLGSTWTQGFRGFSVQMAPADARAMASEPGVAYVEQDQRWSVAAIQNNPNLPWNLDRLDQRSLPLDGAYQYDDRAGVLVNVYVVDTGIRTTKQDFGTRAVTGVDEIGDGKPGDCDGQGTGHGTAVAGVIGGERYGVAKLVNLISVRAFDCQGHGTTTSIQSGLMWAINDIKAHRANGKVSSWPAVINMSATIACSSGCNSQTIVDAENAAVAAGTPVVVAAGNGNQDASANPFVSSANVISVGASTQDDKRWVQDATHGSNFGANVTIWAPGDSITSDGNSTDDNLSLVVDSGTSLAAAHVSGAAALLLAMPAFANATPAQITAQLTHDATVGVLQNLGAGSPNLLLSTIKRLPGGGSPVALANNANNRLELFGVTKSGSLVHQTQPALGAAFGDAWLQATTSGWFAVAAETNLDGRIELDATTPSGSIFHRQQAAANANSWFNWHQLDGLLTSVAVAPNADGRLEMFGTNRQGQVFYRKQTSVNSATWGPWSQFTATKFAGFMNSITAARDANGRIVLVGLTDDGQVLVGGQELANRDDPDFWLPFQPTITDVKPMIEVALATNDDGRLELLGTDGEQAWHISQKQAGGIAWNIWAPIGSFSAVIPPTHVAAETDGSGRVALVIVDQDGNVWQSQQEVKNATSYSPWTLVGPVSLLLRS